MFRLIFPLCFVAVAFSVAGLSGCRQSSSDIDSEQLAKQRARLTLAEEPDGAQVVTEVRNTLLEVNDDHDDHEHSEHSEHETGHADAEGHDHTDADHAHDNSDEAEDDDGDDEDVDEGDVEEDAEEDGHDENDHADHDHADHDHGATVVATPTAPIEVVLVGQIGGLANPWQETQPDFPFARNQAAFFLADTQTVVENEESEHAHAPGEECAFCAAHAADLSAMLAMVRFLDDHGDVLRMEVRQLFDVKEGDTVVIQGTARVIAGGMMVVDATGLYVRR